MKTKASGTLTTDMWENSRSKEFNPVFWEGNNSFRDYVWVTRLLGSRTILGEGSYGYRGSTKGSGRAQAKRVFLLFGFGELLPGVFAATNGRNQMYSSARHGTSLHGSISIQNASITTRKSGIRGAYQKGSISGKLLLLFFMRSYLLPPLTSTGAAGNASRIIFLLVCRTVKVDVFNSLMGCDRVRRAPCFRFLRTQNSVLRHPSLVLGSTSKVFLVESGSSFKLTKRLTKRIAA